MSSVNTGRHLMTVRTWTHLPYIQWCRPPVLDVQVWSYLPFLSYQWQQRPYTNELDSGPTYFESWFVCTLFVTLHSKVYLDTVLHGAEMHLPFLTYLPILRYHWRSRPRIVLILRQHVSLPSSTRSWVVGGISLTPHPFLDEMVHSTLEQGINFKIMHTFQYGFLIWLSMLKLELNPVLKHITELRGTVRFGAMCSRKSSPLETNKIDFIYLLFIRSVLNTTFKSNISSGLVLVQYLCTKLTCEPRNLLMRFDEYFTTTEVLCPSNYSIGFLKIVERRHVCSPSTLWRFF